MMRLDRSAQDLRQTGMTIGSHAACKPSKNENAGPTTPVREQPGPRWVL